MSSERKEPGFRLWRENDRKARKDGARNAVYWVKRNKKFERLLADGENPEARGVKKHIPGNSYKGEWKNDKKSGFGTQTWANGAKYEGDWLKGRRHGKGTQWIRVDGKLKKEYSGDWANGKKEGLGVHHGSNGESYEGEWKSGKPNGRGKKIYSDGNVYEGDFVEGAKSGLGVLTLPNGDRYEGQWLNDQKNGPGRFFYHSTQKVYEGEWIDGVAKCGIYHDFSEEAAYDEDQPFDLPPIGLADPTAVVNDGVVLARRDRCLRLGKQAIAQSGSETKEDDSHSTFSFQEVRELREAFHAVCGSDGDDDTILGSDLASMLSHLGIYPDDTDLAQLLSDVGASEESRISFVAIIGVLSMLRAS